MKIFFIALIATAFASGCATGEAQNRNSANAAPAKLTLPATVFTPADISKLRWIEGSWKGTGGGAAPFYERYSFRNETTLAVESFDDEAMTRSTETTLFVLQEGHFGTAAYTLAEITGDSAKFVPALTTVKNSFVWRRENDNTWKADLSWPADGNKPARQATYTMAKLEQATH